MDQKKTGKFIAQKRKEKSLTQQELADILGISNKTISKWECGNGLPEVSLMLPLCEALEISVNELLSGEELDNRYVEKAEENLIGLIKEKENQKLSRWELLKLQIVSLLISIVIWFALFGYSNVYSFSRLPTTRTLTYMTVGFILIYATVLICCYAIIKKTPQLIITALILASLICLLICLKHKTLWLIIPIITGMAICFILSTVGLLKNKK